MIVEGVKCAILKSAAVFHHDLSPFYVPIHQNLFYHQQHWVAIIVNKADPGQEVIGRSQEVKKC